FWSFESLWSFQRQKGPEGRKGQSERSETPHVSIIFDYNVHRSQARMRGPACHEICKIPCGNSIPTGHWIGRKPFPARGISTKTYSSWSAGRYSVIPGKWWAGPIKLPSLDRISPP